MLLERGADLNKEDKNDRIAEYVAQKFGAEECQQLLSHHIEERGNRLAEQANEVTYILLYLAITICLSVCL